MFSQSEVNKTITTSKDCATTRPCSPSDVSYHHIRFVVEEIHRHSELSPMNLMSSPGRGNDRGLGQVLSTGAELECRQCTDIGLGQFSSNSANLERSTMEEDDRTIEPVEEETNKWIPKKRSEQILRKSSSLFRSFAGKMGTKAHTPSSQPQLQSACQITVTESHRMPQADGADPKLMTANSGRKSYTSSCSGYTEGDLDMKNNEIDIGPDPLKKMIDYLGLGDTTSSSNELAYVEEYLSTNVSVRDRKKLNRIQQFNKMDLIVRKHLGKGMFSDVFEVVATVVMDVIPTLDFSSSDRVDLSSSDRVNMDKLIDATLLDKLIDAQFPSQNGGEPEKSIRNQANDLGVDLCVSDVDDLSKEAEEADIDMQVNALFDATAPRGARRVIREDLSEKPNQDKVKEASEFRPARVQPRSRSRRATEVGGSICLGSLRRPSDHNPEERKMILAMKCLRPQIRSNADLFQVAIKDLAHETAMLASLDHPNIIKIHGRAGGRDSDSFRLGEDFFILLDRLTETLEERMHRWKNLSYDKSAPSPSQIKTACSIADALAHLHSKRIIFRDLKPANVGFDSTGMLKLFDFGFAVGLDDPPGLQSTDHGGSLDGEESDLLYDRCGTPRYMAPEVGLDLGYGLSADVYSFGILLWQICSLKKPFCHVKSEADLQKSVFEKNSRPKLQNHCPQVLRDLMTCCWSSSPNERPEIWYVKTVLSAHVSDASMPQKNRKGSLRGSFTLRRSTWDK